MPSFDRTFFHPVYLDLFWSMIAERMRIYYRREEGLAPPWSLDPIMQSEFITNVYRELDPGTIYAMESILAWEEEEVTDKIFNIFIYRLMGSRIETHERIGFQRIAEWDPAAVKNELKTMNAEGTAPFGEAYRTAAYVDMGSKDKLVNVTRLFTHFSEEVPSISQQLQNCQELQACYNVLKSVKGFGDFLAYQIMVDFLYPAPSDPILPFDQETWAQAGPGARRGIWKLMKPGMKPSNMLEPMRWLRDHQAEEFERLNLEMLYMKDSEGEDVPISLCNIQSCLCEFFKYTRIWDGTLKYARKYEYRQPKDGILTEPPLTFKRPADLEAPQGLDEGRIDEDPQPQPLLPAETVSEAVPATLVTNVVESSGETIHLAIQSNKPITEIHIKF